MSSEPNQRSLVVRVRSTDGRYWEFYSGEMTVSSVNLLFLSSIPSRSSQVATFEISGYSENEDQDFRTVHKWVIEDITESLSFTVDITSNPVGTEEKSIAPVSFKEDKVTGKRWRIVDTNGKR
jgi:hypothetical protein